KLTAPQPLRPLIRQLLGDIAIFPDLEQALDCRRSEPGVAIATLAGEYLSTEGILFGGSAEVRASSMLERKAEIAELAKQESALAKERDSMRVKCDQMKTAVEIALRLHREFSETERKIENLQSEKTALERQIATADERIANRERELKSVRDELAKEKTEFGAFQAEQKQTTSREQELTEAINQLRLAIATDRQRNEHLVAQREPMSARDTELIELIGLRNADIATYKRKLAAHASESKESEALIQSQTAEREKAEANRAKIASQRAMRLAGISDREKELRQLRDSLGELQDKRAQRQVRESQLQMKIDNLVGHISRSYQLDLRAFVEDRPAFEKVLRAQFKRSEKLDTGTSATPGVPENAPPNLEKLVAELRMQLDNMGPVNLDAVHEYDELEERYKFLESQNADLTKSRQELLDVIARINFTTRKLFAETFEQIRTNFREMFGELFRGGRADLSLLDENDPLNCGIEITAKPPGKQLQSVALLSGGERAMTAVALLFAIYMVRPSPFCILDEVDAPLDENNINCFIRVLDRFVEQSQFIIITHNKRTIAKADILYGVTMEERGVSKLVGVKLSAPAQPVAEPASNGGTQAPRQRHLALAMR
ncbi:MAG: hypothetical protein ACM3KL_04705, partial [Alphaproteobacteria bacterium]